MTARLVRRVNVVIAVVLVTGALAGGVVARELAPVAAEPVAERPNIFGDLFEHRH